MIEKVRLLVFAVALSLAISGVSSGQDRYDPDTIRYISDVKFTNSCSPSLRIEVPLYLFSDYYFSLIQFDLKWSGSAVLDTFVLSSPFNRPTAATRHSLIDSDSARVYVWDYEGGWFDPIHGELGRLIFLCEPDDTLTLSLHCGSFLLGNVFFEYWNPTVCGIDTQLVIHAPKEFVSGDADLSGFVNISDAVFSVSYIFSGGCEPFHPNSADANGDCQISISDVVYLLNYIFGGGAPPQAGCVAP